MDRKMFYSKEEATNIIELVSEFSKNESEEFISIMSRHYNPFIILEDGYNLCSFFNEEKEKSNRYIYEYRLNTYDIEKIINDKTYRISFDSYGILLFKLFVSYISGGISSVVFMSLESIVEYLMTSNVKLDNIQTCILYTILLDERCRKEYFDADYLYNKYYKELKNNNDTCMVNFTEIKCLYNEYCNRCVISKKDISDILKRLEQKRILISNEIEKYKIK